MMGRKDTFVKLFDKGYDYEKYKERGAEAIRYPNENLQEFLAYLSQTHTDALVDILRDMSSEELDLINGNLKVLCIAENWCGDCANGVPIISKLAEKCTNWDFRIVGADDFEQEVLNHYTSAGRKKIPAIIFADQENQEIIRWTESATRTYEIMAEYKSQNLVGPDLFKKLKETPEMNAPSHTKEIFREIFDIARRATVIMKLLTM